MLPQQLSELNNPTIHLPDNVVISPVESARNLGVTAFLIKSIICTTLYTSLLFLNYAFTTFVTRDVIQLPALLLLLSVPVEITGCLEIIFL